MTSSMTPKKWALLGVSIVIIAVAGYFVYDSLSSNGGQVAPSKAPAPKPDEAGSQPNVSGPRRSAPTK